MTDTIRIDVDAPSKGQATLTFVSSGQGLGGKLTGTYVATGDAWYTLRDLTLDDGVPAGARDLLRRAQLKVHREKGSTGALLLGALTLPAHGSDPERVLTIHTTTPVATKSWEFDGRFSMVGTARRIKGTAELYLYPVSGELVQESGVMHASFGGSMNRHSLTFRPANHPAWPLGAFDVIDASRSYAGMAFVTHVDGQRRAIMRLNGTAQPDVEVLLHLVPSKAVADDAYTGAYSCGGEGYVNGVRSELAAQLVVGTAHQSIDMIASNGNTLTFGDVTYNQAFGANGTYALLGVVHAGALSEPNARRTSMVADIGNGVLFSPFADAASHSSGFNYCTRD